MSNNQSHTPEGGGRPGHAGSDSDAEEDVFHDARFPAEEEAVSPVSFIAEYLRIASPC